MSGCQHCGQQHPSGAPVCPVTGESMGVAGRMGTRLDRYQIERLLGTGGFGTVYRAQHVHTGVTVALKVLKKHLSMDVQTIARFLQEARAAGIVGSDHIVKVLDAVDSPEAFLAMEYLEGWDLKELATREGPLPPMRVVLLALQVLDGLGAAHAKGIVHRDMKPANVFVLRRSDDRGVERDFVKLLDFGISKMHGDGTQSALTMTGVAMGTPSYMAPEQFFDASKVDGRADLYSVAVMLYELLSGRLPFDSQSYAELIVKIRTEQPPFLQQVAPAVPLALAQVVMVGLAREREQRWPNALEFANALRSAMSLPAKGQTPAFATPPPTVAPHRDTPSMMLGKTATPSAAVRPPAPVPGGGAPPSQPNIIASPSLVQDAKQLLPPGWVVPGPPGMMPPGPPMMPPGPPMVPPGPPMMPPAPPGMMPPGAGLPGPFPAAAQGWVGPQAPPGWSGAPVAMNVAGRPGAMPKPGSGLKWLFIIGGIILALGGCCTCGAILAANEGQLQGYSP